MAVPPNLSMEEKKRLRQQALGRIKSPLLRKIGTDFNQIGDDYQRGGLIGERGVLASAMRQGPMALGAAAAQELPNFDEFLYGRDGNNPAQDLGNATGPGGVPIAPSATTPDPLIEARGLADKYRSDPRSAGLTRIVKNPDGSYTNIPGQEQPGAETRYYNEYGNRETGVAAPSLRRGATPADYYAAVNASAPNLANDDVAMLRASAGGLRSKGFEEFAQQNRVAMEEQQRLDDMDPADLARIMAVEAQQRGANARSAATNAVTMRGQDLTRETAMTTAQREALKTDIGVDQYERERYAADPIAAAREYTAGLGNIPQAELTAMLADPNNQRGARARDAITRALIASGQVDPNFTPSQASKRGGLMRSLTGNPYTANNSFLPGDGFDPTEALGIPDELWQAYMQADALARKPRR